MKRIDKVYQKLLEEWEASTKEHLLKKQGSSASDLAEQLALTRSNTSLELNKLVKLRKAIKVKTYPVNYLPLEVVEDLLGIELPKGLVEVKDLSELIPDDKVVKKEKEFKNQDPFDLVIGHKGSLRKAISQAKAAVYYPPNGLHMLLLGPTGSGKTYFANRIYQYAVYEKIFSEKAPFVSFNCADYHHNPQLLLSQLFGYCKGAFTGANEDHVGLIEKADGGVLLLDEVHRLTPEGQEMLFYFIDQGVFSRLGETSRKRKANVLIICATTENPNSTLLNTFLRRIPMTIQIPKLSDRSLQEKIELTKFLFSNESKRVQKVLRIDIDVINALIQTVNYGNVGQLKSQVQLVCAQAFLNSLHKTEEIQILVKDLPDEIREQWISNSENIQRSKALSEFLDVTTVIYPNDQTEALDDEYNDFNIYDLIEEKVTILEEKGISSEQIHQYILTDLHLYIEKFISNTSMNYYLLKFVDPEVSQLAVRLKEIADEELNYKFDRKFLYYIGMHIDAYLKRGNKENIISNFDADLLKNEHPEEYRVAKLFNREISEKLSIVLPEIEIVYLAMLIVSIKTLDEKSTVSVLVVAHGDSTASSMVNVATELFGSAPITALDMSLSISPNEIFDQLVHKIQEIDDGKGVLMLVEMGSLAMMEARLQEETGVAIKTIQQVTTSMVLDVVRKLNYMNLELNGIYESVKKDFMSSIMLQEANNGKKKAVISICMTGSGTAKKIESILNHIIYDSTDNSVQVLNVSSLKMKQEIPKLEDKYQIVASVGTKDPKLDVPFIPLEKLIEGEGEIVLRHLLGAEKNDNNIEANTTAKDLCLDTLITHLIYLNPYKISDHLLEWTKELQMLLEKNFSNATIIKLLIHTAFAFERTIKGEGIHYGDDVREELREFLPIVSKSLISIEESLELELSKDEKLFIGEILLEP